MQIDKQQILDHMQSQREPGDPCKTDQARDELPQQVDTDNAEHQTCWPGSASTRRTSSASSPAAASGCSATARHRSADALPAGR
jgi:hypothetical protein